MIVFIDESGDPGFKTKGGSSPVFVIALVLFNDYLEAERTSLAIKELRRKLKVSDLYEFKFNKTNAIFKKAFFNSIKGFKYKVRAVIFDKDIIYSPRLRNYKEDFYSHAIMQVLKHSQGKIKNAKLKFDKRGEKEIRDNLRTYLSKSLNNKKERIFKDLKFVDSRQNTLIQLADMVVGCIAADYLGKQKNYLKDLRDAGRINDIWIFK
jgi:hypothetical protein